MCSDSPLLPGTLPAAAAELTQSQDVLLQAGCVASGGLRDLIPTVARAAVAVGVDGIFMEVRLLGFCLLPPPFWLPDRDAERNSSVGHGPPAEV